MSAARRVVVVDSGIDAAHPALRSRATVTAGPLFGADGVLDEAGGGGDVLGHGSAVAATIAAFVDEVEFVSLRVFEREPVCDFGAVMHALRYALEIPALCINLSLGTTDAFAREPLAECIAELRRRDVSVVAPAHDSGRASYPGSLEDAVGVVDDPNVPRRQPEQREANGRTWWFASPLPPGPAPAPRRRRHLLQHG